MGKDSSKLHVVAIPYPAQGHIPMILYLSKKLAAQGVIVTVVNVDGIHSKIKQQFSCPVTSDIRFERIPFGANIPMGFDGSCDRGEFTQLVSNMQAPFEILMKELQPPISCIIADDAVFWSKETAKKFGITFVNYWNGNAAWTSIHQHLSMIVSNGDLPIQDPSEGEKYVSYIPGLTPIKRIDLPKDFHDLPKHILEEIVAPMLNHIGDAEWVLVNSFYELEPHTIDVMKKATHERYISVGPLFPLNDDEELLNTSLRAQDNECIKWLDSQTTATVLYISFGSISVLSETEFEELACGLEESKQPFLCVMRSDLLKSDSKDLYKILDQRTKKQGLFVPWAPQMDVLKHPSVGGFLTHCGWNSALESMFSGVPMLCWPFRFEQSLNCKLIVDDWKIGARFPHKSLKRTEVAAAIKKFMDQEDTREIRKRANELKNATRKAMEEGGSSHNNLQSFIWDLKQKLIE